MYAAVHFIFFMCPVALLHNQPGCERSPEARPVTLLMFSDYDPDGLRNGVGEYKTGPSPELSTLVIVTFVQLMVRS